MIIELDSAGSATAQCIEPLGQLLERCEEENIRDVTLRFPPFGGAEWEPLLLPILSRPFRFSAWFRRTPPLSLARIFLTKSRRLTLTGTLSAEGSLPEDWRKNPLLSEGAPWQVSLFVTLPAPLPHLAAALQGLDLRRGSTLTLGLSWQTPESGPAALASAAEKNWKRVVLESATWCTAQGATLQLACGLPLCIFSTLELGELALLKIGLPLAHCNPELVVTLDGRAGLCPLLPMNGLVKMPPDLPLNMIREQLLAPCKPFAAFCNRADEGSCRSLATAACGGGCMAQNAPVWRSQTGTLNFKAPADVAAL